MADQLNVGCNFTRLGGEGGGRCAISSFYNCIDPMKFINLSPADRRKAYDNIRKQLHSVWEQISTDKSKSGVAKLQRLQNMIYELGNSGTSHDDTMQKARTPAAAWAQLGDDLTLPTKSLGWDVLAFMATEHGVNILLFLCLEQSHDYRNGTPKAAKYWAEADADARAAQLALTSRTRPGGRWVNQDGGTVQKLVPAYAVVDRPWIVLYQRQLMQWTHRIVDGEEETETDGGGHYEAVVKRWTAATGAVQYTGVFDQNSDAELEWRHVQTLANRLLAETNSELASQRMAVDYDNKHKPHLYNVLDAAGVRIPGKNPRKGATANCLPCLVVAVDKRVVGTGKTATHQTYTMWSPQGVLTNKLGVNMLKPLSINNFPELLAFRDEKLTAAERLPSDHPDHQQPLLGTASTFPKLTLENAWKAYRGTYTQRTVNQSRQRKVVSRKAANAADTSIQAARATRKKGYSYESLSDTPASQRDRSSASRITEIFAVNKAHTHYTVRWSEPAGAPAETKERISWLDQRAQYIEVVNAFRAKQQTQQTQQTQQMQQTQQAEDDMQTDTDSEQHEADAEDDGEAEYMVD